MPTQREKAELLRSLHRPGDPLVLVNVWDAVSARIIEALEFPAIATTSAGISWLEGYADGERIPRERMLEGVARITRGVGIPVTADLEAGYGSSIDDAVLTAQGSIGAGAAGLNFEDWDAQRSTLMDVHHQAERIAAIRRTADHTGVPLVINARTDVFLKDVGDRDIWRTEETIRRANLYADAGADSIFVPGVSDDDTIAALVNAISAPINILAGAATPPVARLAELGVARISVGASAMAYVITQFNQLARGIKETGTFDFTARRLSHGELNELFDR